MASPESSTESKVDTTTNATDDDSTRVTWPNTRAFEDNASKFKHRWWSTNEEIQASDWLCCQYSTNKEGESVEHGLNKQGAKKCNTWVKVVQEGCGHLREGCQTCCDFQQMKEWSEKQRDMKGEEQEQAKLSGDADP